jgi:hypothetical protein
MSAFSRDQKRFDCHGLHLNGAADTCPPGKWPFLQNVRSYLQGTIHGRGGFIATPATGLGGPVHSLYRLADPTPFASVPSERFYGVGANLFAGPTAGPFPMVDTGYSGHPLSFLAVEPTGSPQPWLYVADSSRMRKFNVNGLNYPIGIASPVAPPDVTLGDIGIVPIAIFDSGVLGWTSVGTAATAIIHKPRVPFLAPGPVTISSIFYDSGAFGYASVIPSTTLDISEGMLLLFNSPPGPVSWLVEVQEVTIAIAPTTIASIIYEVGATGACVIQPAASLGTGQLDSPSPADLTYATLLENNAAGTLPPGIVGVAVPRGSAGLSNPSPPAVNAPARRTRQTDFPVNALVILSGTETVRILSVATGPDGVQSFRCVTALTHAAGDTVTGVAAFRAFFANTGPGGPTVGMNIYDGAVENTITPVIIPGTTTTVGVATAGIISPVAPTPIVQVTVEGVVRAVQPDDIIHLAIKSSNLAVVQTVRFYLDVDRTINDFTHNYYFFEWRASDIAAAIQTTNTAQVGTLVGAAQTVAATAAVQNAVAAPPTRYHGPTSTAPLATQPSPESAALALGNNQWIDLRCLISDLIHIGTDPSRTLQNVVRTEILVSLSGPATAVTFDYDTLHVSGGYGPDVGALGNPYRYRQSYRSSLTGAVSNPGPASRISVIPRRQRVHLVGTHSADPQADLCDWWRIGGTLLTWTYDGTTANGTPPVFDDVYSDTNIDGGKTLETDNFQPWPSTDLPRTGTCNVSGNLIQWVSGDHFNTAWAEGSQIIVNSRVYTLYGPPLSSTLLYINENAGSGTAVAFTVPSATLLSQLQPILFGGPIQGVLFTFGLGDVRNPGTLTWTKGNAPDTASDVASLQITSPSEPLQNGYLYDGVPFVFSTDQQYVIESDFSSPNQFRALITPCGRGLWTSWAQAGTPVGQAFLAKDGIFVTRGGGAAQSLTDQDLYPLFPHDGENGVVTNGVAVNGIQPPDMTNTDRLRLAYVDHWLYFDYVDILGASHTLAFWFADSSWWFDTSTPGVAARWAEVGSLAHEALIGGTNGTVYTPGGVTDGGSAIACLAQRIENQTDARIQKLYRDVMVELDGGGATTVTLSLGLTNNTVTPTGSPFSQVVVAGRVPYYFNLNPNTMDAFGTNLAINLAWNPLAISPTPGPVFYLYDIGYQLTPELATNWLSGPTTHGLPGFQHVPLVLMCYRSSGPVSFLVIIDGVTYTYTLPSTAGKYAKNFFRLQSVKGLTFQYGFQAPGQAAFQLYDRDSEVWIQPWGYPGSYQRLKPFSGISGLARSGVVGVGGA